MDHTTRQTVLLATLAAELLGNVLRSDGKAEGARLCEVVVDVGVGLLCGLEHTEPLRLAEEPPMIAGVRLPRAKLH